jgi:hypothetical protein
MIPPADFPGRRQIMNGNESRLVLRDVPVFLYLLGLIFAALGGYFFYDGGQAVVLIFLAIGLAILLFVSVVTITADRITRTLTLQYRSVLRQSQKEFRFDDIAGIGVQRSMSGNKSTYQVVLKGKDGNLIPLRSGASSGSGSKNRLAAKLRDFMGVPDFDSSAAGMTYAALQSFIDNVQETDGVRWQIQPFGAARWFSPDFKTSGAFLCLAQKARGQASGGILASVGSMIFKQVLSKQFRPEETPGLNHAVTIAPLDPALEPNFMAYTNAPDQAGRLINSSVSGLLSGWASRYPVEQFRQASNFGQLTVLFSPNGVYIAPMNPLQPNQVKEIAALGAALVRSQRSGF